LATLKDHLQPPAWHDRTTRDGSHTTNDLKITSQSEPRCDVKVVEHLNLVLRTRNSSALRQQIDIVLQDTAEIREGAADAEFVARPAFE
jgi:hypothetical protein